MPEIFVNLVENLFLLFYILNWKIKEEKSGKKKLEQISSIILTPPKFIPWLFKN